MPSLAEVVSDHAEMTEGQRRHLELLTSQWHILADLAFSDLVLWVPDTDPNVFWAAAQIRPATGPTSLYEDVVGDPIAYVPEHLVTGAFVSGEMNRTSENKLHAGIPVEVTAIPIRYEGEVIAVLERHTNQLSIRRPSAMESHYLAIAECLTEMVANETFPIDMDWASASSPHVGDGLIQLDHEGDVVYASPNAVSAYRRLGWWMDLEDENLAQLTAQMAPAGETPSHEALISALSGRNARECEAVTTYAQVQLRVIPLDRSGVRVGAVVVCRDVTDLRNRERELLSKNATIREMHHRVKNNLQTVAALLRMQSRRMTSSEAAGALDAAMARVSSIAAVHEVLSQAFDEQVEFDAVIDQVLRMLATVATTHSEATVRRVGSFGTVSAGVATSLSLVVTELCQNGIEHGLQQGPGEVDVIADDLGDRVRARIRVEGQPLPDDFDLARTTSLGLSIVQSMITDLGGSFELKNLTGTSLNGQPVVGTIAEVVVPRSK
ncbi:sensor histidine kinase [Propionibacteriaceae bacterium Y2011]